MPEEIDETKLKYVLYARKSTDDPQRQVRSIEDQVFECMQLAERAGLTVVDVLREKKSAKKPNQRPIFSGMLKDIKAGKYDSILSWHPDRLARNMREGGEVIDMIDEGQIIDLKFVTHHFTNDANGKMILGLAFVLSKQYSDDLSQKVTRGVRRSFAEGKSPAPKYGYINEGGIYKPDDRNFELMCEAWQMRKEMKSIGQISEHLNSQGLYKETKNTGKKLLMTIQKLSGIFKDSFYYGVLIQAKQTVDLRELYDFQPAVSEEDYNIIQGYSYRKIKASTPHRLVFYPLRKMIVCSFCGKPCRVGKSSGRLTTYLYYRCDNAECVRKKKSIRAKVIFDFIYEYLKGGLKLTEKQYNDYYAGMGKIADMMRQKLTVEIHSKEGALKVVEQELKERSLNIIKYDKDSIVWKTNNQRILDLESQKKVLGKEIEVFRNRLTEPDSDRLSLEQFLNLSKNAPELVKSAEVVSKDAIIRLIFLNMTVDEEKVTDFRLKEPFATLLKDRSFLPSRGAEN
ncbi:MAG: recombinase family protein [Candidatus Woesebacteria bacterium]|nr:MAG: recombinase family protein [Candidatus Woesebacteria bacterium]